MLNLCHEIMKIRICILLRNNNNREKITYTWDWFHLTLMTALLFCKLWEYNYLNVISFLTWTNIEKLAEVERSLRPWGAKEDSKLSEFQVELIQLASQLVGDHLLNSYPDIGKNMTVREGNKYAEDAVQKFLEAGKAALEAGADENTIVTMRPSLTTRTSPSEGINKYTGSYWKIYK